MFTKNNESRRTLVTEIDHMVDVNADVKSEISDGQESPDRIFIPKA
jgi:hypothetical protein